MEIKWTRLILLLWTSTALVRNSAGFYIEPQNQEVREGATAEFYCRCQSVDSVCTWTVNGSQLTRRPGVDDRGFEVIDGVPTRTLDILALPQYNLTRVQCIDNLAGDISVSRVAVLTTRGAVTNLTLQSSTTEIRSTWDLPSLDLDHFMCVDVYSESRDEELVRSDRLSSNQSTYTFHVTPSDPSQAYMFVITPVFEYTHNGLEFSTNGTPAFLIGYFPGVPQLAAFQVSVKIWEGKQVSLLFTVDNAEFMMDGRKADTFSVTVLPSSGLGVNCSGTVSLDSFHFVNSTLTFSLSCSSPPIGGHLIANLTASNTAGSTSLSKTFSTLPLQDATLQHCDAIGTSTPCQFVVNCVSRFVGQTTAVVLVDNGLEDIHSFVATLFTFEERAEVAVRGLPGDCYEVTLLALYGGSVVEVYQSNVCNITTSATSTDGRTKHLEDVTVQSRGDCVHLECVFLSDSPATGCGVLLAFNVSGEGGALYMYFSLLRGTGLDTASDCVRIEEEGWVTVVAFANVAGSLSGFPFSGKQNLGAASGGLNYAIIIAFKVFAIFILPSTLVAIAVGVYMHRRRGSNVYNCCRGGSSGDGSGEERHDDGGEHQLKVIKRNDNDSADSGLYTQTTSTSADADVLPEAEIEESYSRFQESQPVKDYKDKSTLVASVGEDTDPEVAKEGETIPKQVEEGFSSIDYNDAILLTLNMTKHVDPRQKVEIQDADGDDMYMGTTHHAFSDHEMNTSEIPFVHVFGDS